MAKLNTLQDLYFDQLRDLYSAETQLVKALPKMAKAATDSTLRNGINSHLEQTKKHVKRLSDIFKNHGKSPKGKTCKAMKGLVAEGKESVTEPAEKSVRDAGIIAAAQRVEHYEIAGYGCVRTFAKILGHTNDSHLLQQTLDEEAETDKHLTSVASRLNFMPQKA